MAHNPSGDTQRIGILRKISLEYQDLNGTSYETLDRPPTPIEFSRLVNISRPVVIMGFQIPAHNRWSDQFLVERLGDTEISVAITPDGRADAITRGDDRRLYFVEPLVEKMSIGELFTHLNDKDHSEVTYLQSQNGNLYRLGENEDSGDDNESEFSALRPDVPRDIQWATEALGRSPDAVNVWVGNEKSITSIHSDPYENIYTVIRGMKQFVLFPPTEGWCMNERMYPHATYKRCTNGTLTISPTTLEPIRWSSLRDPTDVFSLPQEAQPIVIDVHAGETLYLPAGWWHYVKQQGTTIAVNWWYDLEPRGMNWVWLNFLRGESESIPDGNGDSEI